MLKRVDLIFCCNKTVINFSLCISFITISTFVFYVSFTTWWIHWSLSGKARYLYSFGFSILEFFVGIWIIRKVLVLKFFIGISFDSNSWRTKENKLGNLGNVKIVWQNRDQTLQKVLLLKAPHTSHEDTSSTPHCLFLFTVPSLIPQPFQYFPAL